MFGRWASPTEIASGSPNAIRPTSPSVHGPMPGSFASHAASVSAAIFFGCLAASRRVAARRPVTPSRVSSQPGIAASRSGSGGRSRPASPGAGSDVRRTICRQARRASMPVTFCSRIAAISTGNGSARVSRTLRWSRQAAATAGCAGSHEGVGMIERAGQPGSRDREGVLRARAPGFGLDHRRRRLRQSERRGAVRGADGPPHRRAVDAGCGVAVAADQREHGAAQIHGVLEADRRGRHPAPSVRSSPCRPSTT